MDDGQFGRDNGWIYGEGGMMSPIKMLRMRAPTLTFNSFFY